MDSDTWAGRLLDGMPVGCILWDENWRCIAVNAEGERLCGRTADELIGNVLWELFPAVVGTEFDTVYRRVAAHGPAEAFEMFYPEPLNRWLEIRVIKQRDAVAAYFIDVTARRTAQAQLARAAAHDRTVAQTLQSVLMPDLLHMDGVRVAARYVTAEDADEVGGDWYDAIVTPSGVLTVVIGDVSGHDIAAAATMGQLRAMLRMAVWDRDESPAQLVSRLDRASITLVPSAMATLLVLRIDLTQVDENGGNTVQWTNAGHPRPMVMTADGSTHVITVGEVDAPVGALAGSPRHDLSWTLPAGASLVLYTDGLVENHDMDFDTGVERLRATLARHPELDPEELADAVLADLADDRSDDDIALMVVKV